MKPDFSFESLQLISCVVIHTVTQSSSVILVELFNVLDLTCNYYQKERRKQETVLILAP
jgi:hypothetical protein